MVHLQRKIAKKHSLIMEGRDITSVVLPKAKYKFFLNASDEVRAKRRYEELKQKGENVTFEQVLDDLKQRDERDTTRDNNPLILVSDAVLINTDNLNQQEVANKILSYIKE
jgi:cytidylate kinase